MTRKAKSLEAVVGEHYEELLDWCRRFVPLRLAEPEDLVHGAYLRSRRTYRSELGSAERPLAYLRRSIRSQLADLCRSEKRRRKREVEALKMHRSWHEATPQAIVAAREALTAIRGRPRDACEALLIGKSKQEICQELKMSEGALAVCLSRARAALVRALA
jgi:DNA-directed RNA polymerase specialized sigma24 family protein